MDTSPIYSKKPAENRTLTLIVNISRVIVGVLFIFSGLVKANDPAGLSFKMQEFFDVWGRYPPLHEMMIWLSDSALVFSVTIITLEIIVGIALLLGWSRRFISSLLLLLIIFFTFLTSYAVFSGKIRTCGCFGDCIPLTAMDSFIKDLVLLILILLIYFFPKRIKPLFAGSINFLLIVVSVALVLGFQWFVLRHLPIKDCLPFRKGNNLLALRKMPADAVQDKVAFTFVYSKNGKEQDFDQNHLPDSTWTFVRRNDVIIETGKNNEPPIKDFILNTLSGADSTEAILSQPGDYYLFFVKDIESGTDHWLTNFTNLYTFAKSKNRPIYIIASQASDVHQFFNKTNNFGLPVFSCDVTAVKTAARTNPCLYLMHGPVVIQKWGWADLRKAIE